MGIKFLCPNGHKLHVKAFLSGKRAICPKCGARVVVPTEDSAIAMGGSSRAAGVGEQSIEIPLEESLVDDALESMTEPTGKAVEPQPPAATSHPIDEAPGAVWYVRPSGGGQFGPASGEIMRGWLEEGRVGPNSLVWRAGWSEWRSAAVTFPQLGPQTSSVSEMPAGPPGATGNGMPPLPVGHAVQSVAPAPPAPATAETSMPPLAKAARKRRRKKDVRLIASAILVVVSLILVIVLVLVSRGQGDKSNPKLEEPPAVDEESLI